MVQYWIATSNWYRHLNCRPCSGARDRLEMKIWWFRNRTDINEGDKAIIYLHEKNEQSDGENIKIDRNLQQSFIGYFTVDERFDNKDPRLQIPDECWYEYLFSWDKIPGNHNERLVKLLTKKFGIDWLETAKIEKIDNDKTIKVSNEKNFLFLKLNNEKTKVNMEIDDGRTDEFIAKTKKDKLCIYCWDNSGGWVTIKDDHLCPPDRVVRRRDINNDNDGLLLAITRAANVGLVFKGKTWIKIEKEYYDLVLTALS